MRLDAMPINVKKKNARKPRKNKSRTLRGVEEDETQL
jgi:hypothetical protein